MKKVFIVAGLLASLAFSKASFSLEKVIALTIDDLPFVGDSRNKPSKIRRENIRFDRMIDTLIAKKVPVTGFVVARSIEKGQWELLKKFHRAGFVIANHTYSHLNLNATNAHRYIQNIDKADKILSPLLSTPKFFRYPYLAEGRGARKQQVSDYLTQNGYVIAPVTIDSKDFRFNQHLFGIRYSQRRYHLKGQRRYQLENLKRRYLNFIWRETKRADRRADKDKTKPRKHILLIHANLINSHFIGDIIDFYRDKGYRFISLEEALQTKKTSVD